VKRRYSVIVHNVVYKKSQTA